MEFLGIQRVESNKKIYACQFDGCKSVFDRPYRLAQHRLVHDNVKPFVCKEPNCEKAYTSKSHLDRHIKSVHKETEQNVLYCCPKCMKKYVNRQNLKRHIKVSHIDNNKPFCCALCRIYFKKKHQLRAHMFVHNGIKPFRCPMCDRDFITLYEKKKHMRNHKTYKCEHCEMKFTRWTELMHHKRVDHVSPEYICHDCGKVFKERGHIIRHVKKHLPNTPVTIFFCPYDNCFRNYSRNSNLKQHILVKHEGLTFDCSLCSAKLSTKAKLNEHVERHNRADVPVKVHKTLETGRKKRKDAGTIRYETAMRLAGIVKQKIEEGISRLYNETVNCHDNFKINAANSCVNKDIQENANNALNLPDKTKDLLRDENNTPSQQNQTIKIKVEAENTNESNKSIDFQDIDVDTSSQPPKLSQYTAPSATSNLASENINFQETIRTANITQSTNLIEILNRPSKGIDFLEHAKHNTSTQPVKTFDIQVKIEADSSNHTFSSDGEESAEAGTTSHLSKSIGNADYIEASTSRQVNKSIGNPNYIEAGTSSQLKSDRIKKEHHPEHQSFSNETTPFQGNVEEAHLNSLNLPSSSSSNALSTLLQLYWRTILNFQDV